MRENCRTAREEILVTFWGPKELAARHSRRTLSAAFYITTPLKTLNGQCGCNLRAGSDGVTGCDGVAMPASSHSHPSSVPVCQAWSLKDTGSSN